MSLLPKGIIPKSNVDPMSIIIFSKPKVGKTELCSRLPNSLLIDIERGSGYVDAAKVDVLSEAEKSNTEPLLVLQNLIRELRQANKSAEGGYLYTYGIIDTVTALEDLVLPMANAMYKAIPQGRNWTGEDVRTLPNGAGYLYTRNAFSAMLNALKGCFKHLIILGHIKD